MGEASTRIISSAPTAEALRNTGSVSAVPTLAIVTLPPNFSFSKIAFVRQNSSLGLMTNCTPDGSNLRKSLVKFILEVVSGTLLMHTNIFICYNTTSFERVKLRLFALMSKLFYKKNVSLQPN